jgi:hypothetical protein
MSAPAATRLTCAQTPLAWPASVAITDLPPCNSCVIRIDAPQSGSLQVFTRRTGAGVGDGVTIEEARNSIAIDYRGQRYSLLEAIFQSPGLHVFPGQTDVYPAEYHLHCKTFAAPQRKLVIVVPLTHKQKGPGAEYFASIRARPDPAATRPTLAALFEGANSLDTIQYLGADLLGRTSETPTTEEVCAAGAMETMMALVLRPCHIRAADLERIPREGSLSTDPRDLPVQPRLKPSATVSRAQLMAISVLARPGLQLKGAVAAAKPLTDASGGGSNAELACYPLEVQDGKDVIVTDTAAIPILQLLGITDGSGGRTGLMGALLGGPGAKPPTDDEKASHLSMIVQTATLLLSFSISMGIYLMLFSFIFMKDPTIQQNKIILVTICLIAALVSMGTSSYAVNAPSASAT